MAAWRISKRWPVVKSRTDVLNFLVAVNGYNQYLEVGVRDPRGNFDLIRTQEKDGVDPAARGHVKFAMTSDEFFAAMAASHEPIAYDLILIDGLHLAEQVERDVENALGCLAPGGKIVLHDCNPLTEDAQSCDYDGIKVWNGTVWQTWVKYRATRPDLAMHVVDVDHGCGIISRGHQRCYPLSFSSYDELDYSLLDGDRTRLLNLIGTRAFMEHAVAGRREFGDHVLSTADR